MDGGAALRAMAISVSRSIMYLASGSIVDGSALSCACIRDGSDAVTVNAKIKEANAKTFPLRIILSF
jgi:hypothetical protein